MTRRPIKFARVLRARETSTEESLWEQLRNRRLDGFKFRRQVPIDRYFADFCCIDAGLTIEIDGKQHVAEIDYDLARRSVIESHGFLELRFTNDEVKERLDWVMMEIRRALDIASAQAPRAPFLRMD